MLKIAFLLGRPGSGKSIGACLIEMFAKEKGWSVEYMNDYRLLQQMFFQERAEYTPPEKRKFSPSGPIEYNGFDVLDFSVLDTVLEIMADQVREENRTPSEEEKLFLIEFARNNYSNALLLFGRGLLYDAHLIYLDVGMDA